MQQSFREEYEARSPARKVRRSDQVDKEKLDESKREMNENNIREVMQPCIAKSFEDYLECADCQYKMPQGMRVFTCQNCEAKYHCSCIFSLLISDRSCVDCSLYPCKVAQNEVDEHQK